MSEAVQFHLERQLPELRDFEDKELFSAEEITEIVRKRTKFEYKLQRRISQKADFVAYIKFERALEATRKERLLQSGIKQRHSTSDHSLVQRIYHIYKRAVSKFKGDIELWISYIDYVTETNGRAVLDRLFATALSQHPTESIFWIRAARWEFEGKGNCAACRNLLQKGIRLNPQSTSLWTAYFKFELDFASKLSERREVLGISQPQPSGQLEDVAVVVHKHSILAHPVDYQLHQTMLQTALCYPLFPGLVKKMLENIFDMMKSTSHSLNDFASMFSVEFLSFASNSESLLSHFTKALKCYDEKDQILYSLSMLNKLHASAEFENSSAYFDKLDQLYQSGEEKGFLSEEHFLNWIRVSDLHGVSSADIIDRALSKYPTSSELAYTAAKLCLGSADIEKSIGYLARCSYIDLDFWNIFFQHLSTKATCYLDILEKVIENVSQSILEKLPLCHYLLSSNIMPSSRLDDYCDNFLRKHPSAIYLLPLRISNLKSFPEPNMVKICALYEKMISLDGSNSKVWLDYIAFNLEHEEITKASSVLARAIGSVEDVELISLEYEKLLHRLD